MLTDYIAAAMRTARYELLENKSFYGEIPGCAGVFATGERLEDCRTQLQEVLEGWIILGLRLGHPLPTIDGIELTPQTQPV